MDWRTGRVKFPAERVVIRVFAMICFGVRVRCGAHILKIRFGQWALVWRQGTLGRSTTAEENNRDEGRENG